MNSVGIDISKGRSMVAVMRPFGEVVISSFEVHHTVSELSTLAKRLKSLNGETRVIMEATGNYHFHENHVFSLFVPFLPLTALGRFCRSFYEKRATHSVHPDFGPAWPEHKLFAKNTIAPN